MTIRFLCIAACIIASTLPSSAQTEVSYDVVTEGGVGSGKYMPYYLVSNRHGVVSTEKNSGYVMAGATVEHMSGDWTIDGRLKLEGAINGSADVYLQECYGELSWKKLSLMVGAKEQTPLQRDMQLSSGGWTWSGNSRPIPQAKFGFNDFIAVPFSTRWLEFFFDGCYGYTFDGDYRVDTYNKYLTNNPNTAKTILTKDYWYHYKRGYFRINTHKHIIFTAGIEHAMQFGGWRNEYSAEDMQNGTIPEWIDQSPNLSNFFSALIPGRGDDKSISYDQVFFEGNSVGSINFQLDYQWGKDNQYKVGAYLENPYEDGSAMRKGNGYDGIWGLEYHDKNHDAPVTGAVFEYIQTTHQSGPIHWTHISDKPGDEAAEFIQSGVSGADDYYNHMQYSGYHYYGMGMGNPMIMSPVYNDDYSLNFAHNRIKAWHLGVNGHAYTWQTSTPVRLDYRVMGSYRKSWGTMNIPSYEIATTKNGLIDMIVTRGPWNAILSYAFDSGDLYGNNQAVSLKLNYTGSIFKSK